MKRLTLTVSEGKHRADITVHVPGPLWEWLDSRAAEDVTEQGRQTHRAQLLAWLFANALTQAAALLVDPRQVPRRERHYVGMWVEQEKEST